MACIFLVGRPQLSRSVAVFMVTRILGSQTVTGYQVNKGGHSAVMGRTIEPDKPDFFMKGEPPQEIAQTPELGMSTPYTMERSVSVPGLEDDAWRNTQNPP